MRSAINESINTPTISPNIRGDILQFSFPWSDEKTNDKSALMEIFLVFRIFSHVDSQSMFQNDAFYGVVWRCFSQSVIWEIH